MCSLQRSCSERETDFHSIATLRFPILFLLTSIYSLFQSTTAGKICKGSVIFGDFFSPPEEHFVF